jgi:hypothetical protein
LIFKVFIEYVMKKKPDINTKRDVPPVIMFASTFSGKVSITHNENEWPATMMIIAIALK